MVSRKFSEKKMFYYNRFVDGYPQSKAAKARFKHLYKGKSLGEKEKKRIMKKLQDEAYYYANKLVEDGFLKEQKYHYNGRIRSGNPKVYMATSFTPSNTESATPSNTELLHRVCELPDETKVDDNKKDGGNCSYDWREESGVEIVEKDIEVHHLSYKFKVIDEPRRNISWDKINQDMNGVIQNYLYWPSKEDDEHVTIRYDENPKSDDQIVVWLPSTVIPAGQHDRYRDVLDDYAHKAMAWFQRVAQCSLSLPELYRRPHYAVSVREPEIRKAIEAGMTFKNGEVWMDNSNPKIGPCFETSSMETTKCYSELPDRTNRIEKFLEKFSNMLKDIPVRMYRQEELMKKTWVVLEKLMDSQETIARHQEELAKAIDKMMSSNEKFHGNIMKHLGIEEKKDQRKAREFDDRMYG